MEQQIKWSQTLIRLSALFGLLGAGLGAHMAGAGSYLFRPIHAHILVVGWLTLFSYGLYYRTVKVRAPRLAKAHIYTAIIGAIGLPVGMWLQLSTPLPLPPFVNLMVYIVGGSILLVSFALFYATTYFIHRPTPEK